MSYFALLDSDTENETSNVKITVKKETKDTKSKPAASVPAKPVDVKNSNDQKENKNATAASGNSKDQKKPKDPTLEKKAPKKDNAASNVQALEPDVDVGKEHRMDREHGKTKHHGGRFGGRGDGKRREGEGKPTGPSDHEHGAERAPRKREFDRKSSTGRSGEQRRGGRGPHSFGNEKQEGVEAEKDPTTAEVEVDPLETEEGETPEVPAVPEPELPKVFTYDEYLKKKNDALANVANKELFSEPKAIRAVEKSEFQGLKAKEEEETVFMAKPVAKSSDKKAAPQRSTAKGTTVELAFKVVPAEEGGGGGERESYGGRGGGRGGRGAGGGDREKKPSHRSGGGHFDINAAQFPSL